MIGRERRADWVDRARWAEERVSQLVVVLREIERTTIDAGSRKKAGDALRKLEASLFE